MTDDHPALDLESGYAIQALSRAHHGPIVGWKLAMTSRVKQQQAGITSPIRGFLAAEESLRPGASLRTFELIHPRCEPEIMARDVGGSETSASDVPAATGAVAAGIEVVDSRYVDSKFAAADLAADNASAARFLVGEPASLDVWTSKCSASCSRSTTKSST